MNATHVLSLIIAIAIAGLSGSSYAEDHRDTGHRAPSHEKVRTAFYELEQHGTWHELERYGIAWCPTVATRTRNWNPLGTRLLPDQTGDRSAGLCSLRVSRSTPTAAASAETGTKAGTGDVS